MNKQQTPHERSATQELIASLERFVTVVTMPRNFAHHIEHLIRWLRNL